MTVWRQTAALAVTIAVSLAAAPLPQRGGAKRATPPKRTAQQKAVKKPPKPPRLPCGAYLDFQVLLDRQGFSTGVIDGQPGDNFTHAIAAVQAAKKLSVTGAPDCETWRALGGGGAEPAIATYTIREDDVNREFQSAIPRTLPEQAELPALGYRNALEMIAERFHASPALLRQMNAGIPFEAGRQISVPAVQPFDPGAKPSQPADTDIVLQVTKEDSALRATRGDGTVVFFAPVTTGSEHDPLPIGDWKVTGVQWMPVFHYNPDLFWDAKATDEKAAIKPGPNNPVGVVWIGVNREHYGLHGTPEPENVGHTQSHGCVRLTNWDAARVAALVRPGTPVLFR
jgi:lipoprotein-anchoring transpeptidase ErfK/SrfK